MPHSPRTYQPPGAGKARRDAEKRRGSAHERGYTWRWAKASRAYLVRNPLCVECMTQGRTTAATVTDHITPHKGDEALFWDASNWQALCKRCHDKATALYDGGFSRKVVPKPARKDVK